MTDWFGEDPGPLNFGQSQSPPTNQLHPREPQLKTAKDLIRDTLAGKSDVARTSLVDKRISAKPRTREGVAHGSARQGKVGNRW